MNMTYSAELRPPKELFSRQWFDLWNPTEPWQHQTHRIDETKKKLEDLKTKLSAKLIIDYGPAYVGEHLVNTITLLNSNIGVWQSTFLKPNLPPNITMIYPHTARVMSTWEEIVLGGGGVQRDGVCVTMLSPQCVEWLNTISDWVSEMNTTRI